MSAEVGQNEERGNGATLEKVHLESTPYLIFIRLFLLFSQLAQSQPMVFV